MDELSFERLYLAKDSKQDNDVAQDIYIHKCPLVQHQLDGIRFLYKAFIKKKQAVILNDPSGYGKRVQTALFLSAVLPTLNKPALILSREGKEQQWISCFQQWTQVSDDVAIELSNPYAKEKILVSPLQCGAVFERRNWSVLVVDDDLICKKLQKSSLKADFRIWITSSAIKVPNRFKEDLSMYSTFQSWVYPKEIFNGDKYKANKGDLRDVLMKAAMLDAFLEDTVLRRDCGVAPFKTTQVSVTKSTTEIRTTKKNKDATGTKIKRSKRKSDTNTDVTKDTPSKVVKTTNNTNTTEKNTEEFEIGELYEEKQRIKNTKDHETSDISDEVTLSRNKSNRFTVIWDDESSKDDKDITTNMKKDAKIIVSQLDDSGEPAKPLRWDSDTDSENGVHDNSRVNHSNPKSPANNEMQSIMVVDEGKKNNGSLLENDISASMHNNNKDNKINILDKVDPVDGCNKFSEDLFSTDFTTNANELNVKEIIYEEESTDKPISPIEDNVCDKNNLKAEKIKEKTDKPQNKPDEANLSSFDLKMKQLEELALKKYKGSFLDSIF